MKRFLLSIAIGGMLLDLRAPGLIAAGQGKENPQVQPKRPAVSVADAVDVFYIKRIKPQVELSDEQEARVLPALLRWLQERRDITARRNRLLGQLRQATNPNAPKKLDVSDEDLAKITRDFDQAETDRVASQAAFLKSTDPILNDKQRAKLRVFQDNIERQILNYINSLTAPAQGPPPTNTPAPTNKNPHD